MVERTAGEFHSTKNAQNLNGAIEVLTLGEKRFSRSEDRRGVKGRREVPEIGQSMRSERYFGAIEHV